MLATSGNKQTETGGGSLSCVLDRQNQKEYFTCCIKKEYLISFLFLN